MGLLVVFPLLPLLSLPLPVLLPDLETSRAVASETSARGGRFFFASRRTREREPTGNYSLIRMTTFAFTRKT